MTLTDIQGEHVRSAMHEADELGRAKFLDKYGFGFATTYLVRHNARFYDPKALIGAAHAYTDHGVALGVNDLDATEAIARLRSLHFDVLPFKGLWWVNQGSTYRQEREGGYVWAPKVTKAGHPVAHHVAVSRLRKGQQVVHYASGSVRAIGYVAADPVSVQKPAELTTDAWEADGYGCQITYRDIVPVIPRNDVPSRTADVGPFDVNGDVKQGYLFRVADERLFPLLEFLNKRVLDLFVEPPRAEHVQFVEPSDSVTLIENPIHDLLMSTKNVVLEGVPGTGKSFAIQRLAAEWRDRTGRDLVSFGGKPFAAQVMHPSSSYEDFMEGLRPKGPQESGDGPSLFDQPIGAGGEFMVDDGFFLRVCVAATSSPDMDVLVLVDELNRCNVSSVLGDLLLTIEASRRATFRGSSGGAVSAADWDTAVPVRLPYSGRTFFVPSNVYVVATTNTTDRSVAPLDAAIRRRFSFFRIEPDFDAPRRAALGLSPDEASAVTDSADMLERLNDEVLAPCLGPDAMLGPSYVFAMVDGLKREEYSRVLARSWRYSVLPQLIDVLKSFGAEGLLDASTRGGWFADHGSELVATVDSARAVLDDLDTFLAGLGVRIAVDGTGLARGARVIDAAAHRVDISTRPVELMDEALAVPES